MLAVVPLIVPFSSTLFHVPSDFYLYAGLTFLLCSAVETFMFVMHAKFMRGDRSTNFPWDEPS